MWSLSLRKKWTGPAPGPGPGPGLGPNPSLVSTVRSIITEGK